MASPTDQDREPKASPARQGASQGERDAGSESLNRNTGAEGSALRARIEELECALAFRDQTISALNDVLQEYTQRIDRLEQELRQLDDRFSDAGVALDGGLRDGEEGP